MGFLDFTDFFREGINTDVKAELFTKKTLNLDLDQKEFSDSRDFSRSLQYSPTYVIGSPDASVSPTSTFTSKKEAKVEQGQSATTPINQGSGSQPIGSDNTLDPQSSNPIIDIFDNITGILVIGALGYGAYLVLGKGGKKKWNTQDEQK